MRYARIAPANVLPRFCLSLSGYINPLLPENILCQLPIAYSVCPDLHTCTCYMSFIPVLPHTYHYVWPVCTWAPLKWRPTAVCTLCHMICKWLKSWRKWASSFVMFDGTISDKLPVVKRVWYSKLKKIFIQIITFQRFVTL